eukprot:8870100-Ditylum_brightwellii.AAC.1
MSVGRGIITFVPPSSSVSCKATTALCNLSCVQSLRDFFHLQHFIVIGSVQSVPTRKSLTRAAQEYVYFFYTSHLEVRLRSQHQLNDT